MNVKLTVNNLFNSDFLILCKLWKVDEFLVLFSQIYYVFWYWKWIPKNNIMLYVEFEICPPDIVRSTGNYVFYSYA